MFKDEIEIKIIDNFHSQILNNQRKIRIYLPPSYSYQKDKFYPVLYVHDGQNLFEAAESYSGESWNLHQTADYLIREKMIEEIIIVGVDNMGSERLSEYAHQNGFYKGEKVKARGPKYEKFFIQELMPFVEEELRIKKGSENTALMGSSMGGLVTFNIGLKRPELFSKLAVLSPSLWWGNSSALDKLKSYDYQGLNSKIWLDTGDAEGKFMSFSEQIIAELRKIKNKFGLDLIYYQAADAVHTESAWAARVHSPLLYFFGKIGEIKKIDLIGRNKIAVKGPKVRINPVITYDSSFKMSALEGEFKSLSPDILKTNRNGTLFPQKKGAAKIEFNFSGHKAVKEIKVIERLSSQVKVKIYLQYKGQNNIDELYLAVNDPQEVKMRHLDNSYYSASLNLKRDEVLNFKFTLGSWHNVEKDNKGRDVESHFIKADEDKTLYFEVENFN